jgi:mRNA-degrading endonuclease toxin of MazEF toxin-antitoxin module
VVGKAALTVVSIVYVENVQPPQGGEAKDRRVVVLRAPTGDGDTFTFAVIATLRGSDPADDEVRIPHKAIPGGDAQTSLTSPSVAVCRWVQDADVARVQSVKGKCPSVTLGEIVRKVEAISGSG